MQVVIVEREIYFYICTPLIMIIIIIIILKLLLLLLLLLLFPFRCALLIGHDGDGVSRKEKEMRPSCLRALLCSAGWWVMVGDGEDVDGVWCRNGM